MREFFAGAVIVACTAVAVVFLRARQDTIDTALMLAAASLAFVGVCVGLAILVYAVADVRRAQHPPASHQIDLRRQQIDARTQTAAIVPPETTEVMR